MENNNQDKIIQKSVQQYYGNLALASASGNPTGCCCTSDQFNCCQPDLENTLDIGVKGYAAEDLEALPPDVTSISLGCGDPVTLASLLPGQTVVDLGSGGGIDCFLAAGKVGPTGKVIGIDMTEEMIERARTNQAKLGVENVEFRLGEIENLPFEDNSVDVIISNCVINLSTDKPKVLKEAFRVLKPGGKFAVSDIVTSGHLPESVIKDLSAWASCLGGALDVGDFNRLLENTGFVEISLQPNYWDEEIFNTYIEREPSENDNFTGILEHNENCEITDLQTAIFSAKITAIKPKD